MTPNSITSRLLLWYLLPILLVAFTACKGNENITSDGLPATCPDGMHMLMQVDLPQTRIDILAVMDDSNSMVEEQHTMMMGMDQLFRSLLDPSIDPGTRRPVHVPVTDLHFGVISQDMGTGGYDGTWCSDLENGFD